MARTLLQVINAVQSELGLPVAASVIGNSDLATAQMLALAQVETEELAQSHHWTALMFEYNLLVNTPTVVTGNTSLNSAVITNIVPNTTGLSANFIAAGNNLPQNARVKSVDTGSQVTLTMEATGAATATTLTFAQDTYPEPPGFSFFQNRTMWDRTNRWELLGPDSPQMDQWHRSGIVATGPRRHFRQIGPGIPGLGGNNWRLWPPPAELVNPLQLVFEYASENCILLTGTGSTYSKLWTNDTDICLLDDRAIIMGVKWRYWEQKGFNFLPKRSDYVDYVDRLKARDGAAPTLNLVKRVHPIFISPANVQDGFYPGPVGPNTG